MLKTILNLDGAQQLSRNEQKTVNGGYYPPDEEECGWPLVRNCFGRCAIFPRC